MSTLSKRNFITLLSIAISLALIGDHLKQVQAAPHGHTSSSNALQLYDAGNLVEDAAPSSDFEKRDVVHAHHLGQSHSHDHSRLLSAHKLMHRRDFEYTSPTHYHNVVLTTSTADDKPNMQVAQVKAGHFSSLSRANRQGRNYRRLRRRPSRSLSDDDDDSDDVSDDDNDSDNDSDSDRDDSDDSFSDSDSDDDYGDSDDDSDDDDDDDDDRLDEARDMQELRRLIDFDEQVEAQERELEEAAKEQARLDKRIDEEIAHDLARGGVEKQHDGNHHAHHQQKEHQRHHDHHHEDDNARHPDHHFKIHGHHGDDRQPETVRLVQHHRHGHDKSEVEEPISVDI